MTKPPTVELFPDEPRQSLNYAQQAQEKYFKSLNYVQQARMRYLKSLDEESGKKAIQPYRPEIPVEKIAKTVSLTAAPANSGF